MELRLKKNNEELQDGFFHLTTRKSVADFFEISEKTLIFILYRNQTNNYKEFILKKKSGGTRTILAPVSTLKILQRKFNYVLSLIYEPKPPVRGFYPGMSILQNARSHIKSNLVLNLDFHEFFPSINFGRVRGLLMAEPYNLPSEAATVLAQIACYNNQLPQGAPTSPIISNMICAKLDGQLLRMARKERAVYTRYADDITFSTYRRKFSNNIITADQESGTDIAEIKLGDELIRIILENGFRINNRKTRIFNHYRRQEVTGLVVNERVNVNRRFIRKVRAMLYAWKEHGLEKASNEYFQKYDSKQRGGPYEPKFSEIVYGRINFIRMIRGEKDVIVRRFMNRYNILIGNGAPHLPLDSVDELFSTIWVIKSGSYTGTAFNLRGVGLVTAAHIIKDERDIRVFRWEEWALTPYLSPSLLVKDDENDFAILQLPRDKFDEYPSLEHAEGNQIKHDERITTAGFPLYRLGDPPLIARAKVRGFRSATAGAARIIIDKILVSGESGGPALNNTDEVIGIVVWGAEDGSRVKEIVEFGITPLDPVLQRFNSLTTGP